MINLQIDNFSFGNYSCEPKWVVNERGSVFHRLYYILDGAAVYHDVKEEIVLQKGHLYLFPVNKPYNITHNPAQPLQCLFFHITVFPIILNGTIDIDAEKSPPLYHFLKSLGNIVDDRSKYEISLITRLLESLLYLMGKEAEITFLSDERIQKALDHIHRYYSHKIPNSALSAVAGFENYYFIRLFKKIMGDTPQSYLSKYRLNKAAGLLMENVPLKEIPEKVGFEDAKAFSRAFRKHKGYPPLEYKKSHSLQP